MRILKLLGPLYVIIFMVIGVGYTLGFAGIFSSATVTLPRVPGVLNPNVTQANIHSTICVRGWTSTIRPPPSYTTTLKIKQIHDLHYSDTNPSHYEEDHLVSLELGGDPRNPQNLWPQPWAQATPDDALENALRRRVCTGLSSLQTAHQAEIHYKHTHG